MKKKIITICSIIAFLLGVFLLVFHIKNNKVEPEKEIVTEVQKEKVQNQKQEDETVEDKNSENTEEESQEEVSDNDNEPLKAGVEQIYTSSDLLASSSFDTIPLSAIAEYSTLPENIQQVIKNVAKTSRIYMLKKHADNVLLITENRSNIRHDIQFVKILIPSGQQIRTDMGYNGKIQDSDNEVWDYDDNSLYHTPTKHIKFNKDGDVEFIEYWYYTHDNPIKYEMKDASGNVISLRKEEADNNGNLRVENIIYNKDGNTKTGIITSFSGPNVERFTYFNSDKPTDGVTIYEEYKDGQKYRETLYSSDSKVKNYYEVEYSDGEKESLKVYDSKKQKTGEIKSSK